MTCFWFFLGVFFPLFSLVCIGIRYKPQTAQYLERMQARQGYKVALAAEMQSHDDFDATTIFGKDDGNETTHQDGKNQVASKL